MTVTLVVYHEVLHAFTKMNLYNTSGHSPNCGSQYQSLPCCLSQDDDQCAYTMSMLSCITLYDA